MLVCIYAGVPFTWATLLVIPGFVLFWLNAVWISMLLGDVVRALSRRAATGRYAIADFAVSDADFLVAESIDRTYGACWRQLNPIYHLIAVIREPLLGQGRRAGSWFIVIAMASSDGR